MVVGKGEGGGEDITILLCNTGHDVLEHTAKEIAPVVLARIPSWRNEVRRRRPRHSAVQHHAHGVAEQKAEKETRRIISQGACGCELAAWM